MLLFDTDQRLVDTTVRLSALGYMPNQSEHLDLPRCPHCNVDKPNLTRRAKFETNSHSGQHWRLWCMYGCATCGGVVLAASPQSKKNDGHVAEITEIHPSPRRIADEIPARAREFLAQCLASLHAPAGAVMLAASAVDAMLKAKGLVDGVLDTRIKKAAEKHVITKEMSEWANEIRLDANDQRHADEEAALPNEADGAKALEFAMALAEYLFVLPARVSRGRKVAAAT